MVGAANPAFWHLKKPEGRFGERTNFTVALYQFVLVVVLLSPGGDSCVAERYFLPHRVQIPKR